SVRVLGVLPRPLWPDETPSKPPPHADPGPPAVATPRTSSRSDNYTLKLLRRYVVRLQLDVKGPMAAISARCAPAAGWPRPTRRPPYDRPRSAQRLRRVRRYCRARRVTARRTSSALRP